MPLTADQWKDFERQLSHPYGLVELVVDGYKLSLVTHTLKMRLVIAPYIDGAWQHRWAFEDCEERRRFARPSERMLFSAKTRKGLPKRVCAKYGFNKTHTNYHWTWNSPAALRRHLVKHNTSIELAPKAAP